MRKRLRKQPLFYEVLYENGKMDFQIVHKLFFSGLRIL